MASHFVTIEELIDFLAGRLDKAIERGDFVWVSKYAQFISLLCRVALMAEAKMNEAP